MQNLDRLTPNELSDLRTTFTRAVGQNETKTMIGMVQQARLESALAAIERELTYRELLVVPLQAQEVAV